MHSKLTSTRNRRLEGYNYDSSGLYFITICTNKKVHWFCDIRNSKRIFSKAGIIITQCWYDIPSHFKDINLLNFVVMPDHIHAIIEILCSESLDQEFIKPGNQQKLMLVIGSFKSAATNKVRKFSGFEEFAWQRSFNDRIIRNSSELYRIAEYIDNNVRNWENDEL
jgi:putative transposase